MVELDLALVGSSPCRLLPLHIRSLSPPLSPLILLWPCSAPVSFLLCIALFWTPNQILKVVSFIPSYLHQGYQIFINESTQETETKCLIPLVLGVKKVILVSGYCQLGASIMCKKATQGAWPVTIFMLLGVKPIRLQVEELEKEILDSQEKIEFYRTKIQELVDRRITYCSHEMSQFVSQIISTYISQHGLRHG